MSDPFSDFLKEQGIIPTKASDKKTTFTSKKHREHNHLPLGKFGYVPRPSGNQINIKIAKRR